MKSTLVKFLLFLGVSVSGAVLCNNKIGNVPPLGKFLSPFTGFWQNAEDIESAYNISLSNSKLKSDVDILIDEQGVPHIFAKNDYDLYFAQGYITAKDRLWQMDFQTRYAAGRLSEVVGEKAFELDRYQRRMGMVHGAHAMLKNSMQDPTTKLLTEAYADGINAYIENLSPRNYPIEFKILDYHPEPWTPLNSALLLKLMSATLARGTNELAMTNIKSVYGNEVIDDLFPDYPFREDPIIPAGTKWDFSVDPPNAKTAAPPSIILSEKTANRKKDWEMSSLLLTTSKDENIGSNNWAVSGERSATGFPILANDPHLDLTLPSIWYQIQLHAPDINAYGVSIPGAPSVIVGFNENIAWGVTNVGSDVLDWYKIQFKDDTHQEYSHMGNWRKTKTKIEEIKIRGKASVFDTVYYTDYGPVSYTRNSKPDLPMLDNIPEGYALRWVAHLPSNELKTFHLLNKAKNYDDYRQALSYFYAPAQNFAFADRHGDIAITSNGLFPFKKNRTGKFLLNGDSSKSDWQTRIPFNQNPRIKNPARGYVSSANQWPVDRSYPHYLGWEFAPYERAHRINSQLDAVKKASFRSFNNLLNDNYSVLAETLLDTLLNAVSTKLKTKQPNKRLNSAESESLSLLNQWDYRYEVNSIAATIFETWYNNLNSRIWNTHFKKDSILMRFPNRDRTIQLLLHEPGSPWFSQGSTKLTRNDVAFTTFFETVKQLENDFGAIENWRWASVKKTHVPHLADIDGFGSAILSVGGSKHTVNAMGEKNGPSWRMIVLLGNKTTAFGVIPGGQSGNPGSKFYDNQIRTWENGELNKLLFLESSAPNQKGVISKIQLKTH